MYVHIFVLIYNFNTQLKTEKEREETFDYCGRNIYSSALAFTFYKVIFFNILV